MGEITLTTLTVGWIDVLAILIALAFAAIGLWRGFRREILVTLAGIVPGVMLGSLWGDAWASDLASRMQGQVDTFQGVFRLGSLVYILLLIGYGSGFFLPRRQAAPFLQRLLGGLVGLLNGLLAEAFAFQYIQRYFLGNEADSTLQNALISSLLLKGLPWMFLGVVVIVSWAVVIIALVRLARYIGQLTQPQEQEPAAPLPSMAQPPAATTPVPAVEPPVVEETPPPAAEPTVPCPNCGEPVAPGASFCLHCGKKI
ncbi:MAG: zinc ribbon domain-containing protein [Chloroflexia bacterium]|nr:zinc ribbon domain-containing protein [Chloroflexia bacterium]